jgi:hypothetical protein
LICLKQSPEVRHGQTVGLGSVKITPALYLSDRENAIEICLLSGKEMGQNEQKINNLNRESI